MMRLVGGVFLVLALVPTIGAASPDDEAEMPEIFVPRYCEADDFSGDCETSYAIGDELPDPPDAVPLDRKAPPVIYDEPKPLSRITVEELDGRQIDGEMMDGRNATAAPINNTTLPPEIPEFTGDKKVPVFVVTVTCFTMAALGCVVVTLRSRADERRTRLAQEALRNQITREETRRAEALLKNRGKDRLAVSTKNDKNRQADIGPAAKHSYRAERRQSPADPS
ncbi:unnamed protein product, partial [Mesorhabditis spiculigera]